MNENINEILQYKSFMFPELVIKYTFLYNDGHVGLKNLPPVLTNRFVTIFWEHTNINLFVTL